jgi:hypothetical protein
VTVIRLLPVPITDPPYDDELETPQPQRAADAVQGALALAFTLPSGVTAIPATPVVRRYTWPLHVVGDTGIADPDPDDDEFFDAQPTPREQLPDPGPVGGRLAQALAEVVCGARPLGQLLRWTTESVYADVGHRLTALARDGAPGTRGIATPVVRSVHVSEPCPGVAEVCALVQRGGRAIALALRLEGRDGRWQCTALEMG